MGKNFECLKIIITLCVQYRLRINGAEMFWQFVQRYKKLEQLTFLILTVENYYIIVLYKSIYSTNLFSNRILTTLSQVTTCFFEVSIHLKIKQ